MTRQYKISRTRLWWIVALFADKQSFFKLRTEHLVGKSLPLSGSNWKATYSLLARITLGSPSVFFSCVRDELAVRILLHIGRDPSACNNVALLRACQCGYFKSIEILLGDERVDPYVRDCKILYEACERVDVDLLALLLTNRRIDIAREGIKLLRYVCNRSHETVLRMLLEDGRLDPSVDNNAIMADLLSYNILKILLEDGRVDPAARGSEYLIMLANISTSCSRTASLELLLKDGRVDPTVQDNLVLRTYRKVGNQNAIELLIRDGRCERS